MQTWKQTLKYLFLALAALLLLPVVVAAGGQSSSTNYQVNEVFIGSGGELNACSSNYCSKQALGELGVGKTCSSGTYCAQAGFNTDRSAYIEFTVSNTNVDLGTLTSSAAKTTTATFSVKAYLSHGYSVINASDPPHNGSYTMHNLAVPTASSAGTEQFGINLVANTSPTGFGADPVQVPNSSFAFGQVSAAYSSTNLYTYNKGDVVALSNSSTSDTDYTISYIFNVSNVTPGGAYTLHHVLVATATY